MTSPTRPALPIALLAALLVCPVAAADAGHVTAERASYHGGADHDGGIVAFFLLAGADPAAVHDALLSIDIKAERFEALQVETRTIAPVVNGVGQPVGDPRHDRSAPPDRTVLEKARATLVGQRDNFQVHVLPVDAAGTVGFTARTDAGQFVQYPALVMDTGRFEEPGPLDTDARVSDSPEFWAARLDEPLVVHDDQASHFQAQFTGDFVLEILGGDFEAQDRDQTVLLESGQWVTPVGPTGTSLPAGVEQIRQVLLRIFLEDATVRLGFQGATTDAYWASRDISSTHDGDATLEGASGEVMSGDGPIVLQDGRYVLPAGTMLTMTPGAPAMALAVQPSLAASTAVRASDDGKATAFVGAIAVLALIAAVGLGLARKVAGTPDLREVELALEGEKYGRAARLAKRILRVRPGLEDAVLGRAIALSRSGRAGAAISEIHDQLATRGATDGSLHYVLGLSFLDVGRETDASIALAEAVRRTPALQADVASRLGHASTDPHPAKLREVQGYA